METVSLRKPKPKNETDPEQRDPESTEASTPRSGSRPRFKAPDSGSITVTKVEQQKRNPERVNVFVEGHYAFSLEALLAVELGLRQGQVLDAARLEDVLHRDEVSRAVEAAVNLLSYRPRTETEFRQCLVRKGYDAELAVEAIERLRGMGYVNDADFARFWVQNREQFKPMGARRLRYELLQKGVDRQTADEVIEETLPSEEDDAAFRVARAKLRTYSGVDYPTFRRRMGGFLARQGFTYETSARVIKQLWAEQHDEAEGDDDGGDIGP